MKWGPCLMSFTGSCPPSRAWNTTDLAQFSHVEDSRGGRLRLIDPCERRIAAVRLPVVEVEFMFQGCAEADIDSIKARFFAHFRRGG